MPYDNNNFSIRGMKELFRDATNKRISKDSAKELRQELNEKGLEISEKALELTEERGRKTVKGEDILDAVRELK